MNTKSNDEHGTYARALRHRRARDVMCEPCRIAYLKYQKGWRTTSDAAFEYRERDLARKRAALIVARRHPDEYAREIARDMQRRVAERAARDAEPQIEEQESA